MEKIKKNKVLLVSVIFGALFVVGHMILWVFAVRSSAAGNIGFLDFIRDFFYIAGEDKTVLLALLVPLLTVITIVAFVTNTIGWYRNSGKLTLASGILSFFSLNWISAKLCLVEHFDAKKKIANKFLLYVALFTLVFVLLWIALWISMFITDTDYAGITQFFVYSYSAMMGAGVALNFIAWKKDSRILKLLAGVFYLLGGFTIISAIACFVYHWIYYKITFSYVLKKIKDNFFLYTAVASSVFVFLAIVLWFYFPYTTVRADGSSSGTGGYFLFLYYVITMSAGVILHFVAWKKNARKLKILAGVLYLLGVFTIVSAIICFVYVGKDKRKDEKEERPLEKAAE
jgi:hypothetical protein